MKPACLICHNLKTQLFLKRDQDSIWHCPRCDSRFIFPQPPKQFWPDFYGRSYFKKENTITGYPDYQAQRELYLFYFQKKLEELKKLLTPRRKIKLLDVGCAFGLFLDLCQNEGFEVEGLDISDFAIREAQKIVKGKVHQGTLENISLPVSSFDVVTCFQTVEHFPNPVKSLKIIHKILKPGGILLITTPDPDSLLSKVLSKKWHGWYAPAHLFHFSKKSFFNLLLKAGFSQIEIKKDFATLVSLRDILEGIEGHYWPILANIFKFFLKLIPTRFQKKRFISLFFMRGFSATCFKKAK